MGKTDVSAPGGNKTFITITPGSSASGNDTVKYSVAANQTGTQWTGTLSIAGKTFPVTEAP